MSADTGSEPAVEDLDPFHARAIRSRLPSALSDEQARALIASIRNPDASFSAVGTATAVESHAVVNALDSVLCGVLGGEPRSGEWIEKRNGPRQAETFAELSRKQRAVVDYLARNPGYPWASESSRDLLAEIQAADEGLAAGAPSMHYTYPKRVAAEYTALIEERRRYLREHTDAEIDGDGSGGDAERLSDFSTPRPILERAGYALPEENLDGLDETAGALDDEARLELAFKNAAESDDRQELDASGDSYLGPLSCRECGFESSETLACPACDAPTIHDGAVPVEDHYGQPRDLFDDEDVSKGVVYVGVVNAVEPYGAFVTIGGNRTDGPGDISGLLPEEKTPFDDLLDYNSGDLIHVVVVGEERKDDGSISYTFGWPTEGRVRGHLSQAESGSESEGAGDESEASGSGNDAEESGDGGESESFSPWADTAPPSADEFEALTEAVEEQAERIDALERENERLREQVEENAEALPTGEQADRLNEAVETVLETEERLDDLSEHFGAFSDRIEATEEELDDAIDYLSENRASVETVEELRSELETIREETAHPDAVSQIRDDERALDERLTAVEKRLKNEGGDGDDLTELIRLARNVEGVEIDVSLTV